MDLTRVLEQRHRQACPTSMTLVRPNVLNVSWDHEPKFSSAIVLVMELVLDIIQVVGAGSSVSG